MAISHVAKSLLTERQKLKVRVLSDVRELLEAHDSPTSVRHLSDICPTFHDAEVLFVLLCLVYVVCRLSCVNVFHFVIVFLWFLLIFLLWCPLSPDGFFVIVVWQNVHGMFMVIGCNWRVLHWSPSHYPGFCSTSVGARLRRGTYQQEALCGSIVDVFSVSGSFEVPFFRNHHRQNKRSKLGHCSCTQTINIEGIEVMPPNLPSKTAQDKTIHIQIISDHSYTFDVYEALDGAGRRFETIGHELFAIPSGSRSGAAPWTI